MNPFHSPLRYPGGKTKLAPFIQSIFRENDLGGMDYVEPYAGGAGVALSLLFEEYVPTVTINDNDLSIYAFWHSITKENKLFCDAIENSRIDVDNWREQKQVQKNKDSASLFDLGFSTFFLNRTNVSGIVKGGIIGGINQNGKYKLDARFNKKSALEKIYLIGKYQERISVKNRMGLIFLRNSSKKKIIYLDPPYWNKGKDLYMNSYSEQDHERIARFLLKKEHHCLWILSYDKCAFINALYKKCKKLEWSMSYGTSHGAGKEMIYLHPSLKCRKSKEFLPENRGKTA